MDSVAIIRRYNQYHNCKKLRTKYELWCVVFAKAQPQYMIEQLEKLVMTKTQESYVGTNTFRLKSSSLLATDNMSKKGKINQQVH